MKKIDIHAHVFKNRGFVKNVFLSIEDQLTANKETGIDLAVVLPLINYEIVETPQHVEEIAQICKEYPNDFVFFMNIDPRSTYRNPKYDYSKLIEYYLEMGAKGIGEICAGVRWDDPLMENLLTHVNKYKLPLTFHLFPKDYGAYGIRDDGNLSGLEGALSKFPDIKFLGHSADFWSEISGDDFHGDYPSGPVLPGGRVVELMRKYDNLLGDVSAGSGLNALSRDRKFGISFLNEFSDRLYLGHDFCNIGQWNGPCMSRYLDELFNNNEITSEVYEKICYQNAEKLLKL